MDAQEWNESLDRIQSMIIEMIDLLKNRPWFPPPATAASPPPTDVIKPPSSSGSDIEDLEKDLVVRTSPPNESEAIHLNNRLNLTTNSMVDVKANAYHLAYSKDNVVHHNVNFGIWGTGGKAQTGNYLHALLEYGAHSEDKYGYNYKCYESLGGKLNHVSLEMDPKHNSFLVDDSKIEQWRPPWRFATVSLNVNVSVEWRPPWRVVITSPYTVGRTEWRSP
jgi:hypothetical protein